jgi:hypothetical protein
MFPRATDALRQLRESYIGWFYTPAEKCCQGKFSTRKLKIR